MIKPGMNHSFKDLTSVNKGLVFLVIALIVLVLIEMVSHKRTLGHLASQKKTLIQKNEQMALLENLYHSLEKKQSQEHETLAFFDDQKQALMAKMPPRELIQYLAGKNNLSVGWIDGIMDEYEADHETYERLAVSMTGDYLTLKPFFLDLVLWPRLEKLPLIQVISNQRNLDILIHLQVSGNPKGKNGGDVHE